jgi:glycerol-3-phosphate dehydrogenase (NAD(P)+)
MKLNISVLGAGSWGTTFAASAARNATVELWCRDATLAAEINGQHHNSRYLGDLALPSRLRASTDLAAVATRADVLVVAVPSHGFRETLARAAPHVRPWVPVISLSKGLEQASGLRMSQLIAEILPGHPAGVLGGPNLAQEILSGKAAASVLAMEDPAILRQLQQVFSSGVYRVYSNTDVIGCEVAGVLKNVIAIACGMADGMGAGDNTRAAMITRGLAEMSRLGVALGGQAATFAGLAGLGDLVTTCSSRLSRNRHVGEQLGRGRLLEDIIGEMRMVAEGVKSTAVAVALADRTGVEVPMIREVGRVLAGGSPKRALRSLIRISAGAETDPG